MAKQEAMSLQARRARPIVATGIALATAGILVAVPAIAPPLTARDVQVAEDVQNALSTAQVNLALSAEAISAALLAFQEGGPVNAVLAGIAAEVGERHPLGAALLAFQGGGPVGAVLTGVGTALGDDTVLAAALLAFQEGGPVNAVLAGVAAGRVGHPVGSRSLGVPGWWACRGGSHRGWHSARGRHLLWSRSLGVPGGWAGKCGPRRACRRGRAGHPVGSRSLGVPGWWACRGRFSPGLAQRSGTTLCCQPLSWRSRRVGR